MLEYDIEHLRGVIFFRFQKFDSVKNLTENDLIVYKTNKSDKFRTICIDDIKTRFENQIVLLIHQLIKQNYLIKEITLENNTSTFTYWYFFYLYTSEFYIPPTYLYIPLPPTYPPSIPPCSIHQNTGDNTPSQCLSKIFQKNFPKKFCQKFD
jgi:hypothetical protein